MTSSFGWSPETRNHLFFYCPYLYDLWSTISLPCNLTANRSWDDTLSQLKGLSSNRYVRRLTLMALKETIYWLWNERNNRLHRAIFRGKETLSLIIDRQIRNRIQSQRVSNLTASSTMIQYWFATSP
ncbi:hypothetical protein Bca4012_013495 [Brassica carinata]